MIACRVTHAADVSLPEQPFQTVPLGRELKPQLGIKGFPGHVTIDRGALPQFGRDRAQVCLSFHGTARRARLVNGDYIGVGRQPGCISAWNLEGLVPTSFRNARAKWLGF